MKIAVLGSRGIGVNYGGIETAMSEMYPRIADMGHEVRVFTRSRYRASVGAEYKGVRPVYLPSVNSKHLDTITHMALSVPAAMLGRYDVVHFHALGPAVFSALSQVARKKTVVTVHGLDWRRAKWNLPARAFLQAGEYFSAKFPDATIVVSKTLKKHYENRFPDANVYYVPNGVPLREPLPPGKIKQWGLEKNGYVLFVSRLTQEKGVHTLIEAWLRLNPGMPLAIVGDNPFEPSYVSSLHEVANGKNIVFTGYQTGDTLKELYSNAYLYVLPSEIEGLPITLLEAMSFGRCPLVSDIPENAEVAGDVGFTFESGNTNSLAQKLNYLLKNSDAVAQSGTRSLEHVIRHYNWNRVAEKTLDIYEKILSKTGRPRKGVAIT